MLLLVVTCHLPEHSLDNPEGSALPPGSPGSLGPASGSAAQPEAVLSVAASSKTVLPSPGSLSCSGAFCHSQSPKTQRCCRGHSVPFSASKAPPIPSSLLPSGAATRPQPRWSSSLPLLVPPSPGRHCHQALYPPQATLPTPAHLFLYLTPPLGRVPSCVKCSNLLLQEALSGRLCQHFRYQPPLAFRLAYSYFLTEESL